MHARLTPFGEDGPWAGFATSDLVSLALGGVVMNCGYDPDPAGRYDLPPVAPQAWHSFHIAGEQLVIGIVSALLYRLRSGLGQKVSVAIHEAVAKNTEMDLMSWVMLRQPVYRQTCRHALATITNPSIRVSAIASLKSVPRPASALPSWLVAILMPCWVSGRRTS